MAQSPAQTELFNRAQALRRERRYAEAAALYEQLAAAEPGDAAAQFNLGVCRQQLGNYREAIAAFEQVGRIMPQLAEAHVNLALLHHELGQPEQGLQAAERAIAINSQLAPAFCNRGLALQALGALDAAIDSFRTAVRLNPQDVVSHGNLLYALNFTENDPASVFAEHRQWASRHADPLTAAAPPHDNPRDPARRLRVGYVSAHFREHAVNSFVEPILAAHDQHAVEVFCYADVAPAHHDRATARLQSLAGQWRDTLPLGDEQLAQLIRADQIDILVDLAGHIGGNRLLTFARKPAPVQATYLGYQATTGMQAMDYRLTDSWSDPPGSEAYYTEALARLDPLFYCYRPAPEAPAITPLPAASTGAITFGSFNYFAKIRPAVLDTWGRLLAGVAGSRLIVLAPNSQRLAERVWQALERGGVARQRVEFVPRCGYQDYLRAIQRADVALDAFPFNGHTTTCDALWLGVPVVTLAGGNYVSRFGTTAVAQVELNELVTRSPAEYIAAATRLAGDLDRLAALRGTLRERMAASAIVDNAGFARRLEAAYRRMWQQYCERGD